MEGKKGLMKKGIRFFIFVLLYFLGVFFFLLLLSSGNPHRIKEELKTIIPIVLEVNFVLIIVGIIISFDHIKRLFISFSRKERYVILALVLGSFLMSLFFFLLAFTESTMMRRYTSMSLRTSPTSREPRCAITGHTNMGSLSVSVENIIRSHMAIPIW